MRHCVQKFLNIHFFRVLFRIIVTISFRENKLSVNDSTCRNDKLSRNREHYNERTNERTVGVQIGRNEA
jgi:hypothetical protein